MNPGQQSLDLGLEKVEGNNAEWVRNMRVSAKSISIVNGKVSADDLRFRLRIHGHPDHPNAWGAIFKGKIAGGRFHFVSYARSTSPSRNGGMLRVWRWVKDQEKKDD